MRALDLESKGGDQGAGERLTETKTAAARRTRGGTAYQHSLSARGIKSSGQARSHSDEDLLSSLERLHRAARRSLDEDEETEGRSRSRAFGRHGSARERTPMHGGDGTEQRVRVPRFEW